MFRRNPDFIAVIVVALYLVLGNAGPAIEYYIDMPSGPALREEIQSVVKDGIQSILQELALTIHH
jgi:hypothetical protein